MSIEKQNLAQTKSLAVSSFKWSVLAYIVPKLAQPLSVLVLAWLLTPYDYGIVGLCSTLLTFAMLLQEMGLTRAIMHYQESVDEVANIAFWANTSISALLTLIVILIAPIVAAFYSEPHLVNALRVQSIVLLLNGLSLVQETLLRKTFQFKKIFVLNLLPVASSFLVAIPLATMGLGYWSLIIASLVSNLVRTLFFWFASQWRPRLDIDRVLARKTLLFGVTAMLEVLQAWIINIGDRIVIGYYLGALAVGQYVFTDSLMLTVFSMTAIGMPVAFSAFCRLQNDYVQLSQLYQEVVQSIAVLAIPAGLGLAVVAGPLVDIVLGPQWQSIKTLVVLLGIYGLTSVASPNTSLFTAIGRPEIIPKIHMFLILYLIPTYLLGVQFGLIGFTVAKISQVIFMFVQTAVVARILKLRWNFLWELSRKPLLAGLVMAFIVKILELSLNPGKGPTPENIIKLTVMLVLGASTYVICLYLLDAKLVNRYWNRLRQVITSRSSATEQATHV